MRENIVKSLKLSLFLEVELLTNRGVQCKI